ncbi:het-E-1 heterokaryon incompatibility protein [Fusarium subglutinans]|uniref:Het-E-1 heterokaryon incompatibility protein n=1 Tax=Gibberella subglutinans TaxID=42677 RepID=A0A8H5P7N3_GIBSU|nr:het-E-1 heterokaryon incompatibility protein [Fusarium subglutinans]KAF5591597.1 het-E-1 heterokaryon incompatibility protein [Fusarium subglutinans]
MSTPVCLWKKARENLPKDVKDWLASLEQGIQPNATGAEQIDALIEQTSEKQKGLEKSNHKFRKYFDKVIHWLDKFKGIGDVVSSFDPVHAALPWAAFRFVLEAILAEREQADSVLELLASAPYFVFSGRVLEMVYTKESMNIGGTQHEIKLSQQCLDNLHEELIKLYSEMLSALQYCYVISNQHKVKRKATAIFNSSEVISIHKDLEFQHMKAMACGEHCHKLLSHTVSRTSLDLLQKIQPHVTELGDRVRELLVRIDESERLKTLENISGILFRAHHEEVSGKRTAGTCEWILRTEKFTQWEERFSSVTILYGNPGAGKTFLTSRVVDYCMSKAKSSEALAFFYCKRDEENRRNPRDILRSILRQLATPIKETGGRMIHVALKDLPQRLALNGTTLDVSTCERLIRELIEGYSRTTIILDALDECDRNTREELIGVLGNLTNGSSKLRVFISSRPDEDILRHFKGTPTMEIEATDNEEDISSFVKDKLFRDTRWTVISPDFQEEVKSIFQEKSQGMFQWAALQVDQIRRLKLWSERSIGEQLKASPIGLKGAYDVVWSQIQEMSPYEEQLARRALQWALCAFRPLNTSDLLLMMQIDPDSGTIEADTAFTSETIQSICGNLLVYDRQSNVWRFSHLSAREYIERHHYSMLESHHHAAISSIKFLARDLVPLPRDTKPSKDLKPLWVIATNRSHPDGPCVKFAVQCRYIVSYVFRHAHKLDLPEYRYSELSNLLRNIFEPLSEGSSSFTAWKRLLCETKALGRRVEERTAGQVPRLDISSTPLQIMSIYGLFHTLRGLWDRAGGEIDVCRMLTPSPLTLAIMYEHESIWKFILLSNAEVNKGAPGPLTAAIEHDNVEAFEALLEAGADVNDVHPYYGSMMSQKDPNTVIADTPLRAALWRSRKQHRRYFIQRLLDGGADVNLRSRRKTTLQFAIEYADEETVRILLDANTELHSPDYLLRLATRNRKFNLVPLFVEMGANVEKPWEGVLPLLWALREGNLLVVQYLLEMLGTSIDLSCQGHREAILSSLWFNEWETFAFLFGSNPHINWKECETDTLRRTLRSYPKYEYVLHGLGFDGYNFSLQCLEGTPHHQLSLVDPLLNAGADPSVSVNFGYGSTLTAAAFHGRLHHARALLDQEMFRIKQEQRALFRTALFFMLSGHLGFPHKRKKPIGNECLCPKYLKVLLRLFEEDLSAYMPIYDFLDPLIPLVYIDGEGYEIHNSCHLHAKGYFGYFSRLWFSIIWDLQDNTSPQLPLSSQLRQWQFPEILPPSCSIVTKMTALSRARPIYFIKLSIRGSYSQFSIVPTKRAARGPSSHRFEGVRWAKYKPENFGVTRFPDPDYGTESSNTEVPAAAGKFVSSYGNMFALVLAAMVGLTSCFIALALSARKHS